MSGIPYLGSKISLISKSEIRYEGILVDVNPQESTITFEQVRFFGTEGRRPGDEIAPMDRVFDCVVFRSADIKDLQVYETPAAVKEPELHDPAIVSFKNESNSSTSAASSSGFQYKTKSSVESRGANDYAASITASNSNNSKSQSFPNNRSRSHNQISYTSNQRQGRGIVVPQSEFDFSQANAKFEESTDEKPELPTGPSYNKSLSFFDDISCQANSESTDRGRNERSLNMETFGQAAPPRRYGHRGGRGGRGGYNNNRYRGNYNNSNNNNTNNNNNS